MTPGLRDSARDPDPDLLAWVREHGLDPHQIAKHGISVDDDGRVHLRRYLLRPGEKYVVDGEVAWEPIVVVPKRPFPG